MSWHIALWHLLDLGLTMAVITAVGYIVHYPQCRPMIKAYERDEITWDQFTEAIESYFHRIYWWQLLYIIPVSLIVSRVLKLLLPLPT